MKENLKDLKKISRFWEEEGHDSKEKKRKKFERKIAFNFCVLMIMKKRKNKNGF